MLTLSYCIDKSVLICFKKFRRKGYFLSDFYPVPFMIYEVSVASLGIYRGRDIDIFYKNTKYLL